MKEIEDHRVKITEAVDDSRVKIETDMHVDHEVTIEIEEAEDRRVKIAVDVPDLEVVVQTQERNIKVPALDSKNRVRNRQVRNRRLIECRESLLILQNLQEDRQAVLPAVHQVAQQAMTQPIRSDRK